MTLKFSHFPPMEIILTPLGLKLLSSIANEVLFLCTEINGVVSIGTMENALM